MYYKGMTGTPEEGHVVEGALAMIMHWNDA